MTSHFITTCAAFFVASVAMLLKYVFLFSFCSDSFSQSSGADITIWCSVPSSTIHAFLCSLVPPPLHQPDSMSSSSSSSSSTSRVSSFGSWDAASSSHFGDGSISPPPISEPASPPAPMLDYCSMLLGALAAHVGGRWSAHGVNHVHQRLARGQGSYVDVCVHVCSAAYISPLPCPFDGFLTMFFMTCLPTCLPFFLCPVPWYHRRANGSSPALSYADFCNAAIAPDSDYLWHYRAVPLPDETWVRRRLLSLACDVPMLAVLLREAVAQIEAEFACDAAI